MRDLLESESSVEGCAQLEEEVQKQHRENNYSAECKSSLTH